MELHFEHSHSRDISGMLWLVVGVLPLAIRLPDIPDPWVGSFLEMESESMTTNSQYWLAIEQRRVRDVQVRALGEGLRGARDGSMYRYRFERGCWCGYMGMTDARTSQHCGRLGDGY